MSLVISINPTSAPEAFKAITISLFSAVGYNQSEVKEIIKNFVLDFSNAFKDSKTKFFIISFTSDWLYPTLENKEIVIALNSSGADVGFIEITSDKGHDSFLLDVPEFLKTVSEFLHSTYNEINNEKRI